MDPGSRVFSRDCRQAFLEEVRPMTRILGALLRDESGATAIEYGLIAALISVVIIAAVTLVGSNLSSVFNSIASSLSAA
jgi:pilus assembly protein Flp/PilA